jgi:putative transposase
MKYAFITGQVAAFAVKRLCHALGVSVSGYYAWRRRAPSAHERADVALSARIQTAFVAGRGV